MRLLGGVSNPAGQLFHVELTVPNAIQREDLADASTDLLGIESEPAGRMGRAAQRGSTRQVRSCRFALTPRLPPGCVPPVVAVKMPQTGRDRLNEAG